MTDGHKHRHVVVPSWDKGYVSALRRPLWHQPVFTQGTEDRVTASPYPYGPCEKGHDRCWVLTPLGILHRWTGLTLEVKEP